MQENFDSTRAEELTTLYADTLYTYSHELTEYCLSIMDKEDYLDKEKRFFNTLLFTPKWRCRIIKTDCY